MHVKYDKVLLGFLYQYVKCSFGEIAVHHLFKLYSRAIVLYLPIFSFVRFVANSMFTGGLVFVGRLSLRTFDEGGNCKIQGIKCSLPL